MDPREEALNLLKYFYLFDSDLMVKEGKEDEKLLFYWPQETDIQQQTKQIGFSEALVNFTKQFSPDRPCEFVRFQKQKCAYYNPEEGIWMVVAVNVREKETETADGVLDNLLRRCYGQFKLFYGKMRTRLETHDRPNLIRSLHLFIPQFLNNLTFNKTPFFDTMDGLQFFPVDRNIYLLIQCFVNLIESTFPDIRETVVLYDNYLVWSGLNQYDIIPLYQYLCLSLTDKGKDLVGFGSDINPSNNELVYTNLLKEIRAQNGLVSLNNVRNEDSVASACQMFTGNNVDNGVAVYAKKKILCLFFMAPCAEIEFHSFDSFVASRFDKQLSGHLTHRFNQPKDPLEGKMEYLCLYYNHMNQAMKSMSSSPQTPLFPADASHVVMQIHEDFERNPEEIREVMMKMKDGRWIVGRKSEQREFYSLLCPKEDISNIIDIQDFVQKLNVGYFGNIFLH